MPKGCLGKRAPLFPILPRTTPCNPAPAVLLTMSLPVLSAQGQQSGPNSKMTKTRDNQAFPAHKTSPVPGHSKHKIGDLLPPGGQNENYSSLHHQPLFMLLEGSESDFLPGQQTVPQTTDRCAELTVTSEIYNPSQIDTFLGCSTGLSPR